MSAFFISRSYLWHFNGLSGSHRGGGGEERLPGKYGSLNCRGEWEKTTCQTDDCHKIICIFGWNSQKSVVFTHRGIPVRGSQLHNSHQRWFWPLPMDSLFSSKVWMEAPSPGRPSSHSYAGRNPDVASDEAVSMSTVRTFQVMHSNTFHWRLRDQIQPFLHHFIPEVVHWV